MTSKNKNGGQWTDARFRSFITSALRAASRRWPPRYAALKEALFTRKTNNKTGKLAQHYKCAECSGLFVATDVQVDHIHPVVDPVKGFVSWDVYTGARKSDGNNRIARSERDDNAMEPTCDRILLFVCWIWVKGWFSANASVAAVCASASSEPQLGLNVGRDVKSCSVRLSSIRRVALSDRSSVMGDGCVGSRASVGFLRCLACNG